MLVEIAVGDAYGAGWEFIQDDMPDKIVGYRQHPRHTGLRPGQYTDDTQMSLAIAELIIENDDSKWTPEGIAAKFVNCFKRDPRDGYSRGFQTILESVDSGRMLLSTINGDSTKNGAAMRSGPIGCLPDIQEVMQKTALQAKVTHDSNLGIRSAVAAALMTHYFAYDLGPKDTLINFIQQYVPGNWNAWADRVGSRDGTLAVRGAIGAIVTSKSLTEILIKTVKLGGDTDTTCAIAMAAASMSKEVKNDVPHHLLGALENKKFGRDYLVQRDGDLMEVIR